jgi:hypothetical protein
MSIFGVTSTILGQLASANSPNPNKQQFKQGFEQLGQDLLHGNFSQAQSDFTSLQQLIPGGQQNSLLSPASATQSGNPLATAVSQLAQDLKSGNPTAAQSDFAAVQQDLQQAGSQAGAAHGHHHRRHHGGGESSQSGAQQDPISTLFGQLGHDLQSGNLSAAQQAYSSLQQDLQRFTPNNSSSSAGEPAAALAANFSVTA